MPSPLNIEQVPAGNDFDLDRDVPGIDPTDAIVSAKLTIKATLSDADPGALQKNITTTISANGQIVQDGSAAQGNGTATVLFQFTKAETLALGWSIRYFWDISGYTASGKKYTATDAVTGRTVGRLLFTRPVTLALT